MNSKISLQNPTHLQSLIFLLVNFFLFTTKSYWITEGYVLPFIVIANIVIFVSFLISNFFIQQAKQAKTHSLFTKMVYGSTAIKILMLTGSILVYLIFFKSHLHKPSIMFALGIYLAYTFSGIMLQILKTNKQ